MKMVELHSSNFEDALQEFAAGVQVIDPERAILFGSAVKEGLQADDFDILIVAEGFDEIRYQNRSAALNLPENLSIDLWMYTPPEFRTLYPRSDPIRQSMESDNIDLLSIKT